MNKVLIGITSKNRASILPTAINAALSLEYDNKEIAVFDDCSTDNTKDLAYEYPTVTWNFSSEEKGYVYARNLFLNTTDAVYYCSLDDDSWFLDKVELKKAVQYLDAHPDVAALAFQILSPDKPNPSADKLLKEVNNFIGCGHVLRVAAAKEVGCYDPNPGYYGGEEKDLCLKFINAGFKIIRYPSVLIWHEKTAVARNLKKQHRSGVCNDFVFMWRRTPARFLLPSFFRKLYVHLIFPVRYKNLSLYIPFLQGVFDFFVSILSGKIMRAPVSVTAFKKYLRFNVY